MDSTSSFKDTLDLSKFVYNNSKSNKNTNFVTNVNNVEDVNDVIDIQVNQEYKSTIKENKDKNIKDIKFIFKKKKKLRLTRKYASPEKYSHLPPVKDALDYNLICIFVGLNPGVATSKKQHAFAGPTNLFWPLLFESGCVTKKLSYLNDRDLPKDWKLGLTNLVPRTTAEQSELSKEEMIERVPFLIKKIQKYKPTSVCIIGKGVWESIYKKLYGSTLKNKDFSFGWQKKENIELKLGECNKYNGAIVFVVPSTSGRVAAYTREMKSNLWKQLGNFILNKRQDSNG